MKIFQFARSVSLLALSAAFSSTAFAQNADPDPSAQPGGLEEIIVTAQKRAEALSKTAAAISVVGQAAMDSIGARNFEDAVSTMPNVTANGLGGTIAIRGLGTNTLSQSNGTVAYHIDGIFQNSLEQSSATLYDIARVEVLRGPQGTLYGRNATAGVVNVITNNADTDKFEAFGDISYARWNTLAVRAAVNVPISQDFAVRLVGTYNKGDSWMHRPDGSHPDSTDALNLRLAWRAKPSDRITWDARLSYMRENTLNPVAVPTYLYDDGGDDDDSTGTLTRASNPRNIATLPPGTGTDNLAIFGLTGIIPSVYQGRDYEEANTRGIRTIDFRSNLNFELSDALSLTYLMGYAYQKRRPGVIAGLQPYQVSWTVPEKDNAWSHEVNFNYQAGNINAILGLYSFQNSNERPDQLTRLFQPSIDANNLITYTTPLLDVGEAWSGPTTSKTRAVFGQMTYDVSDQFRVTGGARYNWDRASFSATTRSQCPFGSGLSGLEPNVAPSPAFFGPLAGVPLCTAAALGAFASFSPQFGPGFFYTALNEPGGSKNFEKFSWKATAEYDVAPETMVYATVATGYKAGGVGDQSAIGDARFFRPENNINYEAGIRSRLFNNTLSLNLTGFWTDYKDLQIQSTTPNVPGKLISINAGKSRSRGLELEYAWAPTGADRINGYISYLDAKFRDFPGVDTLTGIEANFRGNRLPGAPEFSARISYSHIFDLGESGTITPTASFFYQTKSYVNFTNTLPTLVPDYSRSDLIVRYETANKRLSLEGYVNNIEDKSILSQIFPEFGVSNAYFAPPRSYGVRLGFRY